MKKILFSMFYSILVGEEPDSVFLKKEGKQNQVKMIWVAPNFFGSPQHYPLVRLLLSSFGPSSAPSTLDNVYLS